MARQPKPEQSARDGEDDVLRFVASRLTEARKKLKLTQKQLGEKVGVKQSVIFELEQGSANITLRTLVRMARALETDLRELLPGEAMAAPVRGDIQHVASVLDRLVGVIEERIVQDRQRSEQEAGFLEQLRLFAGLQKGLEKLKLAPDIQKVPAAPRRGGQGGAR